MTFQLLLQSVTFGIFVGALYGLAAVGFSFIFGVMRILNIAHGELIMLGGYGAFFLFSRYGLDPFLTLPLVAVALFFAGVIIYKCFFFHLVKLREELRTNTSLLVSFGLILILEQTAVVSFSADERSVVPSYAGGGIDILGIQLPYIRLGILIISLVLIFGLQLFLNRTLLGKAIRATAENWESATLMGINVTKTYLISFAVASGLAGTAGSMIVVGYSVNPSIGLEWILKAMVISIMAGVGSIGGAFIAGLLLGVAEAISAIFLGPYMQLIGLLMFLLVLMVRPQGLFGSRRARV